MNKNRIEYDIQLTIIIPHFNSSNMLEKLLSTIPKDKSIQIIVVDDKSEECHIKYIRQLSNKYNFEFYLNDRIKSAGTCRNIGLEHSLGKWILFADSDDYFIDNFYEMVRGYFASSYDIVFFSPTSLYIDTGKIANRHKAFEELIYNYHNNQNLSNELFLKYHMIVPWSKLFRNDLIKQHQIQFDEVIASNDVMFSTLASFYAQSFSVDLNVIYCVTKNFNSLTVNMSEEIFNSRLDVFIRQYYFLRANLTSKEFSLLQFTGAKFIVLARIYGVKKVIKVFVKLLKNKVSMFNKKFFHPIFIFKKFKIVVAEITTEKKYQKNKF